MKRSSGVLLHPTSLPGAWGGGDLGPEARRFVRWLGRAGQRWWQILPLGPTDDGGSPYNSPSAFAGDPALISLDDLVDEGWLDGPVALEPPPGPIDHAWIRDHRLPLVRLAGRRVADRQDLGPFLEANPWVGPWARFRALKARFPDRGFWGQPDDATPDETLVREELGVQWLFDRQWRRLRAEAESVGVGIIGDLPIFVSADSVDVQAHPSLFLLGPDGQPEVVAGVPPDGFSPTGQKWGMPLYDWPAHADSDFRWWRRRMSALLQRVDLVRIDHFRGFEAAWHIPAADPDATRGRWVEGPGPALFDALQDELGELPVIAEDLGVITPEVVALRDGFGLPGMRILQFAFGGDPEHAYLPHRYPANCVVYTGTHDNQTSVGWWRTIGEDERDRVRRYVGGDVDPKPSWALMRLAWRSRASLAVAPMQDVLGLGDEARFNVPGHRDGNWAWRMTQAPSDDLADRLATLTREVGR